MGIENGRKKCPKCLCEECVNGGADMIYPYQGPMPNEVCCLEFGTKEIPRTCPKFEKHVYTPGQVVDGFLSAA